jgi:hypothetical protein
MPALPPLRIREATFEPGWRKKNGTQLSQAGIPNNVADFRVQAVADRV